MLFIQGLSSCRYSEPISTGHHLEWESRWMPLTIGNQVYNISCLYLLPNVLNQMYKRNVIIGVFFKVKVKANTLYSTSWFHAQLPLKPRGQPEELKPCYFKEYLLTDCNPDLVNHEKSFRGSEYKLRELGHEYIWIYLGGKKSKNCICSVPKEPKPIFQQTMERWRLNIETDFNLLDKYEYSVIPLNWKWFSIYISMLEHNYEIDSQVQDRSKNAFRKSIFTKYRVNLNHQHIYTKTPINFKDTGLHLQYSWKMIYPCLQ